MRGDDITVPDPEHSLAVVGHGGLSRLGRGLGRVPGVTSLSEPPAADGEKAAVTVLLTDFAHGTAPPIEWLDRVTVGAGLSLAVIAVPDSADALDPTVAREARRLRRAVDATVALSPGGHRRGVRGAVTTLGDGDRHRERGHRERRGGGRPGRTRRPGRGRRTAGSRPRQPRRRAGPDTRRRGRRRRRHPAVDPRRGGVDLGRRGRPIAVDGPRPGRRQQRQCPGPGGDPGSRRRAVAGGELSAVWRPRRGLHARGQPDGRL